MAKKNSAKDRGQQHKNDAPQKSEPQNPEYRNDDGRRDKCRSDDKSKDVWNKINIVAMTGATVIIALATIASVCVAKLQWQTLTKTDATLTATLDASKRLERPYMWIYPIPHTRQEVPDPVTTGIARYALVNYGKTPAIIKRMCWGLQVVRDLSLSHAPDYKRCSYSGFEQVFEPGQHTPEGSKYLAGIALSPIQLTDADREDIGKKSAELMFIARFEYTSIFGDPHSSRFAYSYAVDGPDAGEFLPVRDRPEWHNPTEK